MSDRATEFDRFLDALSAGRQPIATEGDNGMQSTAIWMNSAVRPFSPSPGFAQTLRSQLVGQVPIERTTGAEPPRIPALPVKTFPEPSRRRWRYLDAAAILLLLLPAAWFLAQADGPNNSRVSNPAVSISGAAIGVPSPPTTNQKVGTHPDATPLSVVEWYGQRQIAVSSILRTTSDVALRRQASWDADVIVTLPAGTHLYVDGSVARDGSMQWAPVFEPNSKQRGWVPVAWTDAAILDGEVIEQGALAETIGQANLYATPIAASEPLATLAAGTSLIVVRTYSEFGAWSWVLVIAPTGDRLGWVAFDDVRFAEFPTTIASPEPLRGDIATPVASAFTAGSIVRATDDISMLAGSTIGAQASGQIRTGQQLLVTGAEVIAGDVRLLPVQIVPAGAVGWFPAMYAEPLAPGELIYPLGSQVVGRVELSVQDQLDTDGAAVSIWDRPAGTVLTVAGAPEQRNGRALLPVIEPETGISGWVWQALVLPQGATETQPVAEGSLVSVDSETYLRASFAASSDVIATLSIDDRLRILGVGQPANGEQWLQVERTADGVAGWIPQDRARNAIVAATLAPPAGTTFRVREETRDFLANTTVVYTGLARITNGGLQLLVRDDAGVEAWVADSMLAGDTPEIAPAATPAATGRSTSTGMVTALGVPPTLDSVVVKVGAIATPLYAQPDTGSAVVGSAESNGRYEIVGDILEINRQVWIQVVDPATGGFGWIDAGMPSSRPYLMPVSIELRMTGYLRSGATFGDNLIRQLVPGAAFKPFGASTTANGLTWVTVLDQSTGQIGWIAAAAGSPLMWPVGTTLRTDVAELNLRDNPAADSAVVATLPLGAALTITVAAVEANDAIWVGVRTADGREGYILASNTIVQKR